MRSIFSLLLRLAGAGLLVSLPAMAPAQEVALPLDAYDELWAKAHPEPEPADPPAVPVALEEARLEVIVGAAGARVIQDLFIAFQEADWQSVPLPAIGSFVGADFGPLEGRLGDGELVLRAKQNGRHRVRLEAALELERDEVATRPTWKLSLIAPAAALVSGDLTVEPGLGEIEEIEAVGPAFLLEDGGRFLAAPGQRFHLVLRGPATVPERALLPLRFEAISANRYQISRQRHRLVSQIALEVLQGRLEEVRLPLPPGFEVLDASGSEIAGWDVEEDRLVVTPLAAVDDDLRFTVEARR